MKYYVRWRYIPIDLAFTPVMYISVDHSVVEAQENANGWEIAEAICKELSSLSLRPEHIKIEDYHKYQ